MSVYTDDAYQILGVPQTATEKEIKVAYRKLALQYHPDRIASSTDPALREKYTNQFVKIANAYEVLTDEYLRAEYNQRRREDNKNNNNNNGSNNTASKSSSPTCNSTKGSTGTNYTSSSTPATGTSNQKHRNKSNNANSSSSNAQAPPEPFRYHFSDPYEVFKRDFRDQFGIEYPGAKYDWIDFNEAIVPPATKSRQQPTNPSLMITNGTTNGTTNDGTTSSSPKKKGFNLFRRGRKESETNNQQLVVADTNGHKNQNGQLISSDNNNQCTDIVLAHQRNNRPVSMDVQTTTDPKTGITSTRTTIVRPDGSTETMITRTGIPGKKPTNNNNNNTPIKQITNGAKTKLLPSTTTRTKGSNPAASSSSLALTTIKNPTKQQQQSMTTKVVPINSTNRNNNPIQRIKNR